MNDDTVHRFQGVYRRKDSNVYQFGLKPPKDLAHRFPPGGWAVRCSLETKDIHKANAKAKALHAEWAVRFEEMRREDNPVRVALNSALSAAIAAELRRWVLQADDNMRDFPEGPRALLLREARQKVQAHPELAQLLEVPSALRLGAPAASSVLAASVAEARDPLAGMTAEEHGAVTRWNAEAAAAAAVDVARRNLKAVQPLADAVARSMGLVIDWASDPAARDCLSECLKAHAGAVADVCRRDAGAVIDTPPLAAQGEPARPSPASAGAAAHSFVDAWQAWCDEEPGRPEKSLRTYRAAADKLAALLPGRTVETTSRADATSVRGALLREAEERGGGTSRNTAGNVLGRIKTLFNVAKRLDWIAVTPFESVRAIERLKSEREDWQLHDVIKLFDDPLFKAYSLPTDSRAGGAASYFVPLLALYTGARISELAQLQTTDIELDPADEGRPVLRFQGRLKTDESRRRIPLHSQLVRLGFLDYWESVKASGPRPLFPAVRRSNLNGAGGKLGEWFGEYKTGKGFDKAHVFHSFRHTMYSRLTVAGVPRDIADPLSGRSGKTVGQRHYLHLRPADLRPYMEKLAYPGLELPKVFRPLPHGTNKEQH